MIELQDAEGGIGNLPHLADGQRMGNGFYCLIDAGAFLKHGYNDLSGQRCQNIGLYTAAQSIGEHKNIAIVLMNDFHLVAAELFAVFIEAFPIDINVHHGVRLHCR